ncbi:MAG: hypothetical protein AAB834_07925, partial [Patescibacteria group bacterium]
QMHIAGFFAPSFRALVGEAVSVNTEQALPLLSTTTATVLSALNININHGVWPVSPFQNSELYTYCQGLAWKFRNQKQILRAYYKLKNFPSVLYTGAYQNEDFDSFYNNALSGDAYASVVQRFAESSILGELGYIDIPSLLQTYNNVRQGTVPPDTNLYCISYWLPVEMNLHLALRSGQWRP